ncbi:MAG TPA: hypothetical protein VF600_07315 [Abditibacteriaceae bacterium]|jgi:hypothetical protein
MLNRNVLLYGKDGPLPAQHILHAGPLALVYENGDLRYLRQGAHEVLRRIYVAVRDHNWGTVPARIANEHIEDNGDSFRISYDATHHQGEIDFRWHGAISGEPDGTITFSMDGVAHSTFRRNRIGFCVLHPASCAGVRCRVTTTDGTTRESCFPQFIQPDAPFENIKSIAHEVQPGAEAEVVFSGDVFEMEDQRNWIDASFKTFCTPLHLPYPVEIQTGTQISQSVTVHLQTAAMLEAPAEALREQPLQLTVSDAVVRTLPPLGLGVASHNESLSELELRRLRSLHLSHLRVDLPLSCPEYSHTLHRASNEARALGTKLEAALFLTDNAAAELDEFVFRLHELKPPLASCLVFHTGEKSTSESWVLPARERLRAYGATVPVGAGTNAYFTELNRQRPPVRVLDFVSYSVNPQVHAFDNSSLLETLETLATTVQSARRFCGDLPISVSPITLKPRFNVAATSPEAEAAPGELPAPVDARQMSLFGAAWTLGAIARLAQSEVARLTFYETTGWRGVMETARGSLSAAFPSVAASVFPLYHVLADVGEFAGAQVLASTRSDSLKLDGIALRNEEQICVLLANFSAVEQTIEVQGLSEPTQVRVLDETNVELAMREPESFRAVAGQEIAFARGSLQLQLKAYAVARILCRNIKDRS